MVQATKVQLHRGCLLDRDRAGFPCPQRPGRPPQASRWKEV